MPVANCNVCRYHQVMLDIYTLGDDVLREECKDLCLIYIHLVMMYSGKSARI